MTKRKEVTVVAEQICALCVHARLLNDNEHVLCDKKGIVPIDFSCKKQQTDLTKVNIRRKRTIASLSDLEF